MQQQDARAFVMALNGCQPYVPPVVFAQLMGNPICREIEMTANQPGPGEQPQPDPRPLPGQPVPPPAPPAPKPNGNASA